MKRLLAITILLAGCGGSGSDGAESYSDWTGAWKMNADTAIDRNTCAGGVTTPTGNPNSLLFTAKQAELSVEIELLGRVSKGNTLEDGSLATLTSDALIDECVFARKGISYEHQNIVLTRIDENSTLFELSGETGCKDSRCNYHISGTATRQ